MDKFKSAKRKLDLGVLRPIVFNFPTFYKRTGGGLGIPFTNDIVDSYRIRDMVVDQLATFIVRKNENY